MVLGVRMRDMGGAGRVIKNLKDVSGAARGEPSDRRRLARRYVYNLLGHAVPFVGVEGDQGLMFASTADRTVGKSIFTDGDWEPRALPRALDLAGVDLSTGVFVEVGANIGTTTVAAARLARHVVAFEPDPFNFRLLRANLAVNLLDHKVTTVNAGCSAAGTSGFLARSAANSGDHRVSADGDTAIELVRLDDGISDARVHPAEVGFLWIDVQGHEGQVLQGAPKILAAGPPMLMEFWPPVLGPSARTVADVVDDRYPTIIDLHDGLPTTVAEARLRWADGCTDLLCLPSTHSVA
jgi:FkbM family methyltransferase